ncbi:MAG: 2-C-methyl-D-erythritol 4-phosphate cytidylyltransferase [Desulfobacula sp.]|nr:2-C-methyl-D-erythritol 4-phosphate cytidylyltransferase [Desulfobacula sp.]
MKPIETFAIIVAGGKGLRMSADIKKQYLKLGDIPILTKTLMVFNKCTFIDHVILVVPKEDKSYCRQWILDPFNIGKSVFLTEGGNERQDSVFKGLKAVNAQMNSSRETIVLIHDGVRPFISEKLIETCIENAIIDGACVPGIKIAETIKKVDKDDLIQKTIMRKNLYTAQTPQGFKFSLLFRAHKHAREISFTATDDASLVEALGERVRIIDGLKNNIKITTPEDLVYAEYLSKIETVEETLF